MALTTTEIILIISTALLFIGLVVQWIVTARQNQNRKPTPCPACPPCPTATAA